MDTPAADSPQKQETRKSSIVGFIERYIEKSARSRLKTLMVGEVDAFNRIGSTFGEAHAGSFFDKYLEIIRGMLPEGSVVVQLSDRRFAALFPIEAMGGLIDVASELTEGRAPKFVINGSSLLVDVTIGVAVYPTHATSAANLFRRAELALNEARRNEVAFEIYRPDATQQQAALWKFSSDLEKTIRDGLLEVYMQPKIRIQDGTTAGVEALVRWRQESGQLVLPSDFVPLAEQSGSIVPMTWLIFQKIAATVETWTVELDDFTVAVNVSAQVIDDVDFLTQVRAFKETLDRHGIGLQLELTEESLVEDFSRIRKKVDRIRELGIGIAIDDFGKGYSSLTYLKDIPATEIKIDKKFVENIAVDEKDWHIVRATMDLAQAFGMKVVAEGVDNDESLRVLQELGCAMAQGFYISRPMRSDLVEDWLRSKLSTFTSKAADEVQASAESA